VDATVAESGKGRKTRPRKTASDEQKTTLGKAEGRQKQRLVLPLRRRGWEGGRLGNLRAAAARTTSAISRGKGAKTGEQKGGRAAVLIAMSH